MSAAPGTPSLNAIDALRAVAVLEEVQEKLSFLGSIEPDVLTHKEELSRAVGDDVARIMREQHSLEQRYQELLQERAKLKGGIRVRSKMEPITAELESVSRALRENTKTLSRSLRENPRVSDNLKKIAQERDTLLDLVVSTVEELQESHGRGQYSTLLRFVQGEREARERLEALKREQEEVSSRVDNLQQAILRERRDHADDVRQKQAQIDSIKGELGRLKLSTSTVARGARRVASARTEAIARAYTLEEEEKKRQVEELRARRVMEESAHEKTLEVLNAQQGDMASRVARQKEAMDSQLQEKEDKLKSLRAEREGKEFELEQLRQRFEEEERAAAAEEEAQRRRDRKAEEEAARQKAQHDAATAVQQVLVPAFEIVMERMPPKKKGKKGGKKKKK